LISIIFFIGAVTFYMLGRDAYRESLTTLVANMRAINMAHVDGLRSGDYAAGDQVQ
jgi:hypothetical protein